MSIVGENTTVGVIGYGYVGQAVAQLDSVYRVNIYDPAYERFKSLDHKRKAYESDFIFLCVPTPSAPDGTLDISILIECINDWMTFGNRAATLVVKSTVPLNTIRKLNEHYETRGIVYSPEFLSQATHLEDFRYAKELFVGGAKERCEQVIELLVQYYITRLHRPEREKLALKTYNISPEEAELIKLTRNSFYAAKVSFFNEIYKVCEKLDVDYNKFKNMFSLDGYHPWIGNNHMRVPGPDGKFGFGGACLPKDSQNLIQNAARLGVDLKVLKAAVQSNKENRGD